MISVEDVSLAFDGTTVLSDVSFTVSPGEFVGLIGPNGAGKTTVLKTINGHLEPDHGSIKIADAPVSSLTSREVSRRVAVVPQTTSLRFAFTVREIVEMGRTPYADRWRPEDPDGHELIEEALELTAIDEFADRPITEVSGGERQRVLIARALAQETPCLLLDEPTANLDINHELETFSIVEDLVDRGKTVVTAIHDLNLAARFCDRLVMLNDGAVVATGDPKNVLTADRIRSVYGVDASVSMEAATGGLQITAHAPLDRSN